MTLICVGGSYVPEPLTAVQLVRICSFIEEHFLAKPTLLLCWPSKFRENLMIHPFCFNSPFLINDQVINPSKPSSHIRDRQQPLTGGRIAKSHNVRMWKKQTEQRRNPFEKKGGIRQRPFQQNGHPMVVHGICPHSRLVLCGSRPGGKIIKSLRQLEPGPDLSHFQTLFQG
jgi:hypothetical protein